MLIYRHQRKERIGGCMFIIGFFIFGILVACNCTDGGAAILAIATFTAIGVMIQCCHYQDMEYFNNKNGRQKLRDDIKCQDDYDNEWGIIDWHKK